MTARTRIRLVLAVVGVAAVALVAPLIGILSTVDRAIQGHGREVSRILDGVPVRQSTRAAFGGAEEPGNAWDLLRPALDAIWALDPTRPATAQPNRLMEPNFDAHGIPADTPRLLGEAARALEECRRAGRRTRLDWPWDPDPELHLKVGRACRAMVSLAYRAGQEERDADAAGWLLSALLLAQDAARLGQRWTWELMLVVEAWVFEEARSLLGGQDLTGAQLADVEQRLQQVYALRPPLSLRFRTFGALARQSVLDGTAHVAPRQGFGHVPLEETVGWRDLWSKRLCTARVANGIRDGVEFAGSLPWSSSTDLDARNREIASRYRKEDVAQLILARGAVGDELEVLLQWELFRASVGVARAEAVTGKLPQTLAEAGVQDPDPRIVLDSRRLLVLGMATVWVVDRRAR